MEALIKLILAVVVVVGGLMLANSESNSAVKASESRGVSRTLRDQAATAAHDTALQTLEPNEIEMIDWRRHLMGKPGLQFYVIFFNEMGQPVDYFVTNGKCSSSNKRLIRPWRLVRGQAGVNSDGHAVYGDFVLPAAGEDGTYGQSDEYVYCRTVDGKYKQWNSNYYLSDAPIEITIKPLVLDLTGRIQHQQ